MDKVRVLQDIVSLERDPEEESQRRDALIEGRNADAARGQIELVAANIFEACSVRRSTKERREVLDLFERSRVGSSARTCGSSCLRSCAGQRAHCLVGHGDAPVLSEGLLAPHLQDRAPRPAIALGTQLAAAPYRASGLVL